MRLVSHVNIFANVAELKVLWSAMALSEVCLRVYSGQKGASLKAAQQLSQAYRLVNSNLSGATATSDCTIAAVVYLSLYERVQGNFHLGQIHVKGLSNMIDQRGGISCLAKNSHLMHKIFRYFDSLVFQYCWIYG
jgi:hypothetical protein